ncbi:hypothetical protein CCACVL1_11424 [Corchorus capsularis]|uniref:Uncharacterized protein n=1 Tax=Corchorus capsularis TaxID=210143 RepID=A0A1R3ILA6_COCAP|nr:hypothetical protein CCACVL1_11424 [Corchorus capsularis]
MDKGKRILQEAVRDKQFCLEWKNGGNLSKQLEKRPLGLLNQSKGFHVGGRAYDTQGIRARTRQSSSTSIKSSFSEFELGSIRY